MAISALVLELPAAVALAADAAADACIAANCEDEAGALKSMLRLACLTWYA